MDESINTLLDMLFADDATDMKKSKNDFWIGNAKEFFGMIMYCNLDEGISESRFTLYEMLSQFNGVGIES
jgi:hypothetical protein